MGTRVLRLGRVDQGSTPSSKTEFLSMYHASLSPTLQRKLKFRDEGNSIWRPFEEIPGSKIKELQQFLKDAGFMPKSNVDGIFGYATAASVRLFQEYVRTIDCNESIGAPDGEVGPNTWSYIDKWKKDKKGTPDFVCSWGRASAANPSQDFSQWMALLEKAKTHYLNNYNPILDFIEKYTGVSDTKKVMDWDTSKETIHLIGIRRNQDKVEWKRENDDLFALLIKGMVFLFWGSTDPSQKMAKLIDVKNEAFLLEGQHKYKFGWHKVGNYNKVYRALRPAGKGVLVFRDRNDDNALTDSDLTTGIDNKPNTTINIHWSGIGRTNFSAGCQVIAGSSYITNTGDLVDCSSFAAASYDTLGQGQTRGAYNVLTDLILSYAPLGVQTIAYTLGRDESTFLTNYFDEKKIAWMVNTMKSV